MMRGALARLARSAASIHGVHSSAPAAAAQPVLAAVLAGPCGVPSSPDRPSSLHSASAFLTPQQAFAAHSLVQLGGPAGTSEGGVSSLTPPSGGGPSPHLASGSLEAEDEVAARLREHLEAAFSSASAPAPPAGMCAAPLHRAMHAPAAPPTSLRRCTQAVAARLTKHAQPDTPHTLEGAVQPSQQARLIVESHPPFCAVWANPAWEEVSGQDWAEAEGRPCLEVVPGGACSTEGHARGAMLNYSLGGRQVPVRVTATPLLNRDGSSTRMLLVFTRPPVEATPTE